MCPHRTFNEILRLGGVIDGERLPVEAQGVLAALELPLDDGSSSPLCFSRHHPGRWRPLPLLSGGQRLRAHPHADR